MNYNFFPNYKHRTSTIKKLCNKYGFVKHEIIGQSLCGRPIDALTIGNPKDKVLLAGAFHGMEWITTLVLLRFFDECCNAVENKSSVCEFKINRFLLRRGLTIIPCLNPDGVEIQLRGSLGALDYKEFIDSVCINTSKWQANARGVDLNHNFDADWQQVKEMEIKNGITSPGPTRYGGEAPFSEPETQCLRDYCKQENFRHALAFHSQGREIYYDFGESTPPRSLEIAQLLSSVSGYSLSHPEEIAVGGGFKDWFIEHFKKPALTVEIGLGTNPLPITDFEPEYNILKELLCFSVVA